MIPIMAVHSEIQTGSHAALVLALDLTFDSVMQYGALHISIQMKIILQPDLGDARSRIALCS